jgi:uncharacterized protein involved in exopolysaccharide biosynthesis
MIEQPNQPAAWPRQDPASASSDRDILRLDRVWGARRWILAAGVAGALLGILVSLLMPTYFTSSISFIPEEPPAPSLPAGLSGLASQLGVIPGNPGRSPEFYARLLNGRHIREVLALTRFPDGKSLTDYYGTGGHADSVERTIRKLAKDYSVSVDRATSIVRVDVELRDPSFAAEVANMFVLQIDSFNMQLRQSSARARRIFTEARLGDAQTRLTETETALRDFLTQNRAGNAPALQFERSRLERRVSIAQELYLSLARGAQTARIDEVNDTPVISVVAPAFVPMRRSRPRRLLVGFIAGILAAVAAGALASSGRLSGDLDTA